MSTLLEYRLRIRNAADTADALVVTSVRGDTLPYIAEPPNVDGSECDPLTGSYRSGSATVLVADAITSGTDRVVTSQLEDAGFRQQLPGRKAYVEEREDSGSWSTVQAGYVTGLRLVSAAKWAVDVGDTTMAGRNLAAFSPKRDPSDFTKLEPLADFLARWPNRGCLAGGPVIGGFLGMADLGGWEMTVASGYAISAGTVKLLSFTAGYSWPTFARTTNPDDVAQVLNDAVGESSGYGTSPFTEVVGWTAWRDVVVQVGSAFYTAHKVGGYTRSPDGLSSAMIRDTPFFERGIYVNDPDLTLTVGDKVRVRVFDAMPSERSPIYWRGHPVDLAAALCDEAGIAYDATEAAATKDALGASLTITVRITGSQAWSSFTESVLYGPCGFSARTLSTGALAFFATRILSSTLPSVTITSADVPQEETVLFDLSQPDAITKVTYEQQNLIPAVGTVPGSVDGRTAVSRGTGTATPRTAQARNTNPPLDGVTVQPVTVERTSGDTGAAVDKEQRYTIPGFLDTGSQRYEPQLVDAKAAEIFDRDGRGRLSGELALLRSGAGGSVVLGQEITVSLPAMPNHNKRLTDDNTVPGRCVQIVRVSPSARGPVVKFKDSGPNAQPLVTLPTFTLAAGPTGHTVTATITNATTLNASGIAVRMQWALASSAPASTDYSDVAYDGAGAVPTDPIQLPIIPDGLTAYVRARSEQAGHRSSAWTSVVSLASVTMGAPTGLSVTPDATDGSRATVAWTTGTNASAALVDIYLRLSTLAFADAIRMATGLLAGTISYPLSGLIPTDAYIVTVVHRDPVTGSTTSAEYTFTAGSTTRTLSPPTNPVGIVGSTDPSTGVGHLDGTYGLNVTATELPGFVTFWEAIETGVGAGTYGSFTQVSGMVPSVSGGPTEWRGVSNNALLRKQLKARHEADGTNPSTYTSAVTLDAWGVVVSPPIPSGGDTYNQCLATITDSDDTTMTVTVTGSAPSGTPTVQLVAVTSPAALVSGAAIGSPVASGSAWVFSKGAALSGDGGAQFRAVYAGNVSDDDFVVIPERAPDVALGQQILSNPAFANGLTGYTVYDNNASGHVHLSLVTDATAPNASGQFLRVNVDSATTPNVTTQPEFGGFFVGIGVDGGVFRKDTYHKGALLTFRVRARIPVGYTIAYTGNAIGTGGTATALTAMVGTGDWFDYQWRVQIGTSGSFSSTGFWYLSGSGTGPIQWDVAQVTANDANQTPREAVRLQSRARVLSTSATTVVVRYAVADPFPSGTADVTITYDAVGTGGVSPASGGTITPASSLTEAAGTYIDYTITRPAFTAGTGRVTFTASRPGYTSDSDAVDIPAQEKTSFGPSLTAAVTYTSTTASIAYVGSGGTVEVSINGGAYAAAAASPISVSRPAVGSLPITYDFRITADSQTVSAHAVVVPVGFGPSLTVTPTVSPTAVSIAYTYTGTIQLKIDSGAYGAPAASPISVSRDGSDHTYTFKATLDGQEVSVPVDIPALTGTTSAPSITGVLATKLSSGSFSVSWGAANIPSGATYDIHWRLTAGDGGGATSGDSNGNTSSPVTITVPLGTSPEANVSVTAKLDGVTLASGGDSGPMAT